MNFSKMKLTKYLVENAPGVEITSNNPAARNAATSGNMANAGVNKQIQGTVNSRAAQTKQSTGQTTGGQGTNSTIRKKSPTLSDTQMNADQPVATGINSSYDAVKAHVELIKLREASKSDWRQEIMEAANPNDDPNHPFVEVMPFNDYRMKEAQKNMVKAAQKDRQAGGITNMPGMKEEYQQLDEAPVAIAAAIPKLTGVLGKVGKIGAKIAPFLPKGGDKKEKKSSGSVAISKGTSFEPTRKEETIFDDAMDALFEKSVVVGGDYQPAPEKRKSGKALPKGNRRAPVRNYDNTATPAENEARRIVNKAPQLKGAMSKKALKGVETDAFSGK
jgi:hypothetical protein